MSQKFCVFLITLLTSHIATSSDLASISQCAGVIVGDAYVDLAMGVNDELFDETYKYAVGLQFAVLKRGGSNPEDGTLSDKLFAASVNTITLKAETGRYDTDTLIDVINCYRVLAPMSKKYAAELIGSDVVLDLVVPSRIELMRQALEANK